MELFDESPAPMDDRERHPSGSNSNGSPDEAPEAGEEEEGDRPASIPPSQTPQPTLPPHADHMKVYLRVRPFTQAELLAKCQACSSSGGGVASDRRCFDVDSDTVVVARPPGDSAAAAAATADRFTFSRVFGESVGQSALYAGTVATIVDQLLAGSLTSGLVFTYGVTGSGKTYTVQGTPESLGVLPRALVALFDGLAGRLTSQPLPLPFRPVSSFGEAQPMTGAEAAAAVKEAESLLRGSPDGGIGEALTAEACTETNSDSVGVANPSYRYSVWASYAEIYNEVVYDLLEPAAAAAAAATRRPQSSRTPLELRTDRAGRVYIRGLRCLPVASAREALQLVLLGQANQQVAATNLNQQSSRSHTLFAIRLVRCLDRPAPQFGQVSNLTFCDLAGSERQRGSGSLGDRTREAGSINASLLTLHRCVAALQFNQRCSLGGTGRTPAKPRLVPFRDSKLTRFIQPYFSGSGRAVMIANIGQCPALYDETLNALRFSALARRVVVVVANSNDRPATKRMRLTAPADAPAAVDSGDVDNDAEENPDADEDAEMAEIAQYDREALVSLVSTLRQARKRSAEDSEARELQIRCELTAERDRLMSLLEEQFEQQLQQQKDTMLDRHDERMREYLATSQRIADRALERSRQRAAARAAGLAEQLREATAERDRLRAAVDAVTAELADSRQTSATLRQQLADMRQADRRAMDADRELRVRRMAESRRLVEECDNDSSNQPPTSPSCDRAEDKENLQAPL